MTDLADRQQDEDARRMGGGGEFDNGLAKWLSRFALGLQAEPTKDAIMAAVVEAAVAHVPGARYAGVTLVSHQGEVTTPAKTDDIVAEIDRIQYDTGQGPCLSTAREHVTVRAADLATERRWPRFAAAAAQAGVRSMLCLQLFVEGDNLGALNLLATEPGAFDEHSEDIGLLLCSHAAIAMAGADREADLIRAESLLQDALEHQQGLVAQLSVMDGLKHTVLQTLAHDLRGPIAAVQTYTTMLWADLNHQPTEPTVLEAPTQGSSAARMKMLSGLETSAGKMERLLQDLINADPMQPIEARRTRRDVADLVARVLNESELDQRHPIHRHLTSVVVNVDAAQVERIVDNLLTNAAKHLADGVPVWVETAAMGNGVLISVEDAGPGVEPGARRAIFEEFRRGDDPSSPGLGLGLSLVARFARVHGGSAWVEERPGGGASFRVYLPGTEPVTPEQVDTAADAPIRVIICDDDPAISDAFDMLIQLEPGLQLVAAPTRTGQQAIDAVLRHRPDVVVMDLDLIGAMDGYQATTRIKAISPATNVVIVSGTANQNDAPRNAAEAGASTFLPKTAAARELIPTIRAVAERFATTHV